jgi:hypothetical protein
MESFATVESLAAGWRDLGDSEQDIAEVLLGRASAYLAGLLRRDGIAVDISDRIQVINLETVTCNMVRRVMDAPTSGASSISQGIGSTNASVAFSNPDASLYLSKSDMLVLGLAGKSQYRSVQAHTWADDMSSDCCIREGGHWKPIAKLGCV